MTAGPRRLRWTIALVAIVVGAAVAGTMLGRPEAARSGPTVGERLSRLKAERAALQARADGDARLGLLMPIRIDGLLTDALSARETVDGDRALEALPAPRRQAYAALEALNEALRDALARPGEGARTAARAAADRAAQSLEALAPLDDLPLVLQFTPRFVPPRRATGELTIAPRDADPPAADGVLRLRTPSRRGDDATAPTVPRYAPPFAAVRDEDPAVQIDVVGLHLASDTAVPTLAIGSWRGEATVAPERLHFTVPRSAFGTEATRMAFAPALLSLRRGARLITFELLLMVLPDRPGSFALDQRVRTTVQESNTLVSPEILVRAAAGETKSVRRCFDPPPGWRFDKLRRRVVVVERLGWLEDVGDSTMNGGSVDFAPDEEAGQICVVVTARPVTRAARTATIGRFEATLVRDQPHDRVIQSGVRALDWREPVRVPLDPAAAELKLYVRLFDDIDREFDAATAASTPFLRLSRDGDVMVLQADPTAEP
jgi:hypothetical protein